MFLRSCFSTAIIGIALSQAAAVHAADPTKDECIGSSEHGQELRSESKLRDARAQFAVCVAASCPGPIREDCIQQLDAVSKAMPTVVFEVKDATGNDAGSVQVGVDGQPLSGAVGTSIELDPGEHSFHFEAAGFKKIEKRLVIAEGAKERREVVVMDRADSPQVASTVLSPPTEATPTRWRRPSTLAWVAFGVGGAGLVLGVTAGLVAGGKHSTLASECDDTSGTCKPQYSGDLDAFHTWRTVSTVGYVVGALGVAGGGVLWLTAPRARNTMTARVWLGPVSAGVAGRF